jgi:hypothetical protein
MSDNFNLKLSFPGGIWSKKIFMFLLLFCISLSYLAAAPCGDVNSNGKIDIIDALLIAQYSVGLSPENFDPTAADVSGDSMINIIDALQIAQYYVGLITSFAGCVKPTPAPIVILPETAAGFPFLPQPANVFVIKVKHFDNMCWKIAAAGGTWYFENGETAGKSGFSSAFDQAGNDWIGNDADKGYNKSPSNGGKHEYRGWPNFGNGNFDHPQRSSGTKTKWVDAAGVEIPFVDQLEGDHLIMRSFNSTYELEYHFFTTHIAIKVLKAGNTYAFLFEGPIGGEQEKPIDKDYYVLKDGISRQLNRTSPNGGLGYIDPEFGSAKQFPSPFFYFVDTDPKDTQIFYVGAKNLAPSTYGDEGWMQCNSTGANMVVFSFGRKNDSRSLTGTNAYSVFGFLPKATGHAGISNFIESRLASPYNPVP